MRKKTKTILNEGPDNDNNAVSAAISASTVRARFLKTYTGGYGVYYRNNVYELPYELYKVFEREVIIIEG
jgi:hypothetical protein